MTIGDFVGAGSHVPLLASVVATAGPGPVLELGVGDSSTPLLRELCKAMGRELVGVDTHEEWARKYGAHLLSAPPAGLWERDWAVVFIDTSPPPTRLELVQLVRYRAEFIVIHDTDNQGGDLADLVAYFDTFPHLYTDESTRPWTTVVSGTRAYPGGGR